MLQPIEFSGKRESENLNSATQMVYPKELVSVVIPAFNAEQYLDETLRSVRSQTYPHLEIVVVDDGSSDATSTIAEKHAQRDTRIRVLRQANRGSSAARNAGIAVTRGHFVAPIDADDLWAPSKIARQVAALEDAGPRAGLAYSWYAHIDRNSVIIKLDSRSTAEGKVLEDMCIRNLVGNGSSALILREALESVGGYDCRLVGCEDFKLYFQIAERYDFVLVRDFLTGYRDRPDSLSSNFQKMLFARDIVATEIELRHPQFRNQLRKGRTRLMGYMLARAVRTRRMSDATAMLGSLARHDPMRATATVAGLALRAVVKGYNRMRAPFSSAEGRRKFEIGFLR